jgi:hypothetical protein
MAHRIAAILMKRSPTEQKIDFTSAKINKKLIEIIS